ncbi:MAG TPA: 5'/3'-nucleotidase SurE [Candidatus Nanoarchaeia archaeon]|nr:5'/3'-nucleotidase SurE [Candidatus Nanoarchaeia archaeon]
MADILLTNDDGYRSVGFLPLLKELSKQFSVVAVAPSEEKSWIGKSISARKELTIQKVKLGDFDIYSLNGTPADCVQVGLYDVLDNKPKLVISGINTGDNVGHARILSSGTVGAAMEASIDGVKSLASSLYLSLEIKKSTDFNNPENYKMFENAAKITAKLAAVLIDKDFGVGVDLVSLNIPFDATIHAPLAVTVPFREPYGKLFHKKGENFIHVNPDLDFKNLEEGTDIKALSEGKLSITPLSLEMVSKGSLKRFGRLVKEGW